MFRQHTQERMRSCASNAKAISYNDAAKHYGNLTAQVLDRFSQIQEKMVDRSSVRWQTVVCSDDAEQPLEAAACADIMLTGAQRCRNGLCGHFGGHFVCICDEGCQPATDVKPI